MNTLQHGVFLDLDTLHPGDLDLGPLQAALPDWTLYPQTRPEELTERLAGADVVVTNKVVLKAEHLAAAPGLRLICVAATGTDTIDTAAAHRAGILVSNVRNYATDSVVQHVFALLLTLVTRLDAYRADIHAGHWSRAPQFCLLDHPIHALSDLRLGIIGWGVLGQATARVAQAFGMHVQVAQSLRPPAANMPAEIDRIPLDELLSNSDVVSLHCPLTPQTRHLINATTLARMPAGAFLLNTARGALVDPIALAAALRSGRLGGAGIDVLEPEPPPANHPLLANDLPNLVLTPHTAWAARSARQRIIEQVATNIRAFAEGNPRHVVT